MQVYSYTYKGIFAATISTIDEVRKFNIVHHAMA